MFAEKDSPTLITPLHFFFFFQPKRVVQQLKPRPKFLHTYLDALFRRDPHLGYEFHDLQIELYAEFDPAKLLDFLRASNYYSLEKVRVVTSSTMCYVNPL